MGIPKDPFLGNPKTLHIPIEALNKPYIPYVPFKGTPKFGKR